MNYVRTIDGYIFEKEIFEDSDYYLGDEEYILIQADDIEDLCDFPRVEVISDEEGVVIYMLGMYKELPPNESIKSGIYGAILTKNGIIFVARENDEGKLELL